AATPATRIVNGRPARSRTKMRRARPLSSDLRAENTSLPGRDLVEVAGQLHVLAGQIALDELLPEQLPRQPAALEPLDGRVHGARQDQPIRRFEFALDRRARFQLVLYAVQTGR